MKTTDVKCPVCGKMNYSLYLNDSGGWMECENCGTITQHAVSMKKMTLPLIRMWDEAKYLRIPELAGGPV